MSEYSTYIIIIAAIGGILLAVSISFTLAVLTFRGGLDLLILASSWGNAGLIAYVAVWIFLFPVMLVLSIACGCERVASERKMFKEDY